MNLTVVALAAVLMVLGGYLLVQDPPLLPKASVDRILDFISRRYDSSAQERVLAGSVALDEIGTAPLGLGIGGFAQIYNFGSVTDRVYPHNIVLEIAVEEGWVIGLFFVFVVLMALVQGYRCANVEPSMRPFFAIFIYALCNSLVSGDMNDNRIVYALMCIALLSPGIMTASQLTRSSTPAPSPLRLTTHQSAS
jgi:O-antigen ligase